MDAFSLPIDPALNIQGALDYLNPPTLDSTTSGSSASASVPLGQFDYSDWLNPTPGATFDPNTPPTSLPSDSSNPALLRGATPSSSSGPATRLGDRAAQGPSSGTFNQVVLPSVGQVPSHVLNSLLPSTSGQVPYGGDLDLFPSLAATLTQQTARDFAQHQGDIPVNGFPDLHRMAMAVAGQPPVTNAPAKASGSNSHASADPYGGITAQATPALDEGPPTRQRKPSHQADESVPEAALHLLRLALPSASNGSVASTATLDDKEIIFDGDAEGESEATSVQSEDRSRQKGKGKQVQAPALDFQQQRAAPLGAPGDDLRVWEHAAGEPPLQFEVGAGSRAGSGRGSVASSVASGRARSHRPARREQSSSARARSDAGGNIVVDGAGASGDDGRRRSGRVRKSLVADPMLFGDSDGSYSGGDDDAVSDLDVDDSDSDADVGGRSKKGKGKSKPRTSSVAGSAKAKVKRLSDGSSNPTPSKKARTSVDGVPPPPRRARRPPPSLNHLRNRTLPAGVPIDSAFARFYRAFPISASFPPDSYVHRLASRNAAAVAAGFAGPSPSSSASLPQLPRLPVPGSSQGHDVHHNPFNIDFSLTQHQPQPVASTSANAYGFNGDAASASGSTAYENESQNDPEEADTGYNWFIAKPADADWNKSTDPYNLYAPKFVKGSAAAKCGMCPICIEPVARGGFGEEKWLKLKNSSYVYHMSYSHGISNVTGLPFSPPKDLRAVKLNASSKDAREIMREGLCHKCDKWIPLDSTKNLEALVPELFWFKHAKKCHLDSRMEGDTDCYTDDSVFRLVQSSKIAAGTGSGS